MSVGEDYVKWWNRKHTEMMLTGAEVSERANVIDELVKAEKERMMREAIKKFGTAYPEKLLRLILES